MRNISKSDKSSEIFPSQTQNIRSEKFPCQFGFHSYISFMSWRKFLISFGTVVGVIKGSKGALKGSMGVVKGSFGDIKRDVDGHT